MPRPPNPIDQYRDYVSLLYLSGVPRSKIRYKLQHHFHITVDLSTISRRIASWGLPRQQSRTSESPELIEAIRDLVFRVGLTEKQTLAVLQRQGWPITKRGLKRIRLHPDRRWVRRIDSDEERLTLLMKTEQLIIEMTQRSNAISGYGRRFLQPYLRHQKQLWVPRDPLFEMYKIMFPNEVEMRKRMMRRKKGQFLVPGPNYQWCIDGHDKLKAYGFEIYAAIDAYSRNIIWFYVGHSATTALSVLKQYLAACDAHGFRPWYLQADRGRETPLVAAALWNFALAADGRVEWHGQVFEQGKRLRDSYKAGPSTKNVKIESWWERMLHVSSRQWVDYFGELARHGDFDGEMLEDQIAMYAVFEDVLRQDLFDFVEAWNLHRTRLQKNLPHVNWACEEFGAVAPMQSMTEVLSIKTVIGSLARLASTAHRRPSTAPWISAFSAAKLSRAPINEVSIVKYCKSIPCGIHFCLGAIAEDYISWGFVLNPVLELQHGGLFWRSSIRRLSRNGVFEAVWDELWSLNPLCACRCSEESTLPP
ncbi:hypothetical protein E5D57_008236 [Metarhizium anisopliae]|nr:hypothetical protein E5D57_008236 [Metarhizium anisopliae]